MTFNENPVWKKLETFPFDAPNLLERFPERLARRGKWIPAFTNHVIEEYRKFLFLAATEQCILIPPPAVDLAWKMNIEYYPIAWKELCSHVLAINLRRVIPNRDEDDESCNWNAELYERTLELYSNTFHTWPAADIWPTAKDWFNPDVVIPLIKSNRTIRINSKLIKVITVATFITPLFYPSPLSIIPIVVMILLLLYFDRLMGVKHYTWDGSGITDYK